jgi:hypothetical protein
MLAEDKKIVKRRSERGINVFLFFFHVDHQVELELAKILISVLRESFWITH